MTSTTVNACARKGERTFQPIHHLMQTAQLRHLAERVEGRPSLGGVRDVVDGIVHAVGTGLPDQAIAHVVRITCWTISGEVMVSLTNRHGETGVPITPAAALCRAAALSNN